MDLRSADSVKEVEDGADASDSRDRTALREHVEIQQPHVPTCCCSGDVLDEREGWPCWLEGADKASPPPAESLRPLCSYWKAHGGVQLVAVRQWQTISQAEPL